MEKRLATLFCLAAVCLFAADTLKVGDPMPAFKAKDQHDASFELKPGTRYFLVALDMSTGKEANKALAAKGPSYLESKNAVLVCNIKGMPAVGRVFALPKMRKYPHRIVLADQDQSLDAYPTQKGRVTVLKFNEKNTVSAIKFWNPETEAIDDLLK
jgi:hypothetical protein